MMEKILTKEELGKLMEDLKKRGVFAGSGHIPKQKELINTALALYTELDKIKKLKEKWMGIYQKAKKDYFEYGEVPDDEGGEMLLRKNNAEEIVNDLDKIGKEGNEQDN